MILTFFFTPGILKMESTRVCTQPWSTWGSHPHILVPLPFDSFIWASACPVHKKKCTFIDYFKIQWVSISQWVMKQHVLWNVWPPKRMKYLIHASTRMNLGSMMLSKGHVLYDPLIGTVQNRQSHRDRGQSGLPGLGELREMWMGFSWGDENVLCQLSLLVHNCAKVLKISVVHAGGWMFSMWIISQ